MTRSRDWGSPAKRQVRGPSPGHPPRGYSILAIRKPCRHLSSLLFSIPSQSPVRTGTLPSPGGAPAAVQLPAHGKWPAGTLQDEETDANNCFWTCHCQGWCPGVQMVRTEPAEHFYCKIFFLKLLSERHFIERSPPTANALSISLLGLRACKCNESCQAPERKPCLLQVFPQAQRSSGGSPKGTSVLSERQEAGGCLRRADQ